MLYLARIAIALALIGFVCSQTIPGEILRSPRFDIGFIPGEPLVEEALPRIGFNWLEGMREFFCRRFCPSPSATTSYPQNLICLRRCPDFASQGSPGFPPVVTTEPTGSTTPSAGPIPSIPAAPTPPRAG